MQKHGVQNTEKERKGVYLGNMVKWDKSDMPWDKCDRDKKVPKEQSVSPTVLGHKETST